MDPNILKNRTKNFALRILKLIDALPKTTSGYVIGKQLVRSSTSVAANYRAACRGRSKSEFIAKLHIVTEEIDESCFWLEIIMESSLLPKGKINELYKEANELTSIFVSSLKTAKVKSRNPIN